MSMESATHCIDPIETRIKGLGHSEVSANYLDLLWQASHPWVACQCADLHVRGHQSRENLAAKRAGPADNEKMIHAAAILQVDVQSDQGVPAGWTATRKYPPAKRATAIRRSPSES